jgi:hypothetical protein
MNLVSSKDPVTWRIGAKVNRAYSGEEVSVRARFSVVGECRPNTECDGVSAQGSLLVTKAGHSRTVSIRGSCGC